MIFKRPIRERTLIPQFCPGYTRAIGTSDFGCLEPTGCSGESFFLLGFCHEGKKGELVELRTFDHTLITCRHLLFE